MASNVYKAFCRSKASIVKRNELPFSEVKRFEEMPGPKPLPLPLWRRYLPKIGTYSMDKIHHTYARMYREFGPIVRENVFGDRTLVHVFNHEDMITVYENEGELPERQSHRALARYRNERPGKYSGPGLFASNGDEWYRLRQLFQNILDDASISEAYSYSLEEVTDDLVSKIEYQLGGQSLELDVQPLLSSWALECIGMVLLNRRLGCLCHEGNMVAQGLIHAANDIRMSVYEIENSPLRSKKNYKKLEKALDYFACVVEKCIDQVLGENIDGNNNRALLIKMMQHEKASRKDIFTMVLDMFFAGIDTTSHAVSFALYNLATNMRVQEKLRNELVSKLPRKNSRMSNPPVQLPYLQQVIEESLRVNPVSIGTKRIIPTDLVLGGYHVPAKEIRDPSLVIIKQSHIIMPSTQNFTVGTAHSTNVILQHQIASMLDINFLHAHAFFPDRWTIQETSVCNPFGQGPRMCLGMRIARRELQLGIAKLIRNFSISYHRDRIDTFTNLINVPDRPVRLRFQSVVM